MESIQKSKLANIFLLVFFLTLLFLTPFISSSMRYSYLYFLLNLLIIVLGVEAGFLSAISKPRDERKVASVVVVSPAVYGAQQAVTVATGATNACIMRPETTGATNNTSIMRPETTGATNNTSIMRPETTGATNNTSIMRPEITPTMTMEKPTAEKVKSTLKRCKSRPSLFFIGNLEPDCREEEEVVVVKKEEEVAAAAKKAQEAGELSKQELFMKAEMFIGNFYKHLKMQREKSWQKLHGLYHKAL